jgi:hypothetical protein
MERQNLILRRFGVLSFGLGYFANGVWVDHTQLADGGVGLEISGTGSEADRGDIHAWLGCCADETRAAPTDDVDRSAPIAIRSAAGAQSPVLHAEPHVDAVAGRSSAL